MKRQYFWLGVTFLFFLLGGLLVVSYLSNKHRQEIQMEQVQKIIQSKLQSDTIQLNPSVTYLNIKDPSTSLTYIIIGVLTILVLFLSYYIFSQKEVLAIPKVRLTQKENEIVQQIKEGKTNQEIADTLFISLSTAKTHINNIYKKMGIKSRKELL